MSSKWEPLPTQWVERIFARFHVLYGVQKLGAMWTGTDIEEVKRVWAESLGRYPREALSAAVLALPEEHGAWPPTLPEFVALVRAKAEPVPAMHRPALPVPARTKDEIAAGAAQMDRIRGMLRGATKRMPV
jgi:hypothetical protein